MTDRPESPLARLRGGVLPVLDEREEQARRERIGRRVLEVGRELDRRRARWQRATIGVALAACAASIGAFFLSQELTAPTPPAVVAARLAGEVRVVGGQVFLQEGASLVPLPPGSIQLEEDARLVTHAGQSAELRLASDTTLSVAPASELGIARQGSAEERVRLRTGSVALRVPPLGAQRKLSVETRDALIEVHGTRFSVRLVDEPPLEPFTEVKVLEGRVLVRAGASRRFLGPGEAWSSRPAAESPASAPPPAPAPKAAPVATRSGRSRSASASASELAAQNRLLEAAELAQKSGMPRLAVERLDALIGRYPDAELAHNARVERFRLLAAMGRPRAAAAAAREYLEHHPQGFARGEAQRLIEASVQPPGLGEPP